MSVNTEDEQINDDLNISPQENKEDIFLKSWKNVNIDKIKSRGGRPKGSKKPFWNFSSNQSKNNGKKRKRETERDVHNKMIKTDDEVEEATVVLDQIKQENLEHLEGTDRCNTSSSNVETLWLRTPLTTLNQNDKDEIVGHKELGEKIIESAQNILRNQFSDFIGFQSTLVKQNLKHFRQKHDSNLASRWH